MEKYRITYEEHEEYNGEINSWITTLDVSDIRLDKGFVTIWFDGRRAFKNADMAINSNSVHKIERIKEEEK